MHIQVRSEDNLRYSSGDRNIVHLFGSRASHWPGVYQGLGWLATRVQGCSGAHYPKWAPPCPALLHVLWLNLGLHTFTTKLLPLFFSQCFSYNIKTLWFPVSLLLIQCKIGPYWDLYWGSGSVIRVLVIKHRALALKASTTHKRHPVSVSRVSYLSLII